MTQQELKAAYPDLYAAIDKAAYDSGFTAGTEQGRDEGTKTGADTERARIQAVEAQLLPGHDALIYGLKFDGVTTGPEAAVKVLIAEKAAQGTRIAALEKDKGVVIPSTDSSQAEAAGLKEKEKEKEDDARTATEKLQAIIDEKQKSGLSASDALKAAQRENLDLARAAAEEIVRKPA
jgi:hypothetical protein